MSMNRGIKRQKGGAEKKREKSRKLLLADSEKCAKITNLFYIHVFGAVFMHIKVRVHDQWGYKSVCYFHACEVTSVCRHVTLIKTRLYYGAAALMIY